MRSSQLTAQAGIAQHTSSRAAPVPGALAHALDAFWSHRANGAPVRVLPDGCMDWVFDLDAGSARVVGSMTRAELVTAPAGARLFGVRFCPASAMSFLHGHAREFVDRELPLADVRAELATLTDAVINAEDDAARAARVSAYLAGARARLRPADWRVRRATDELTRSAGARSTSELARSLGLSPRQLERLFAEHVGLTPKYFARVMRLQAVTRLADAVALRGGKPATLLGLSARAGYADQAHLQREVRALAGITPRALLAERHVAFVQGGAVDAG